MRKRESEQTSENEEVLENERRVLHRPFSRRIIVVVFILCAAFWLVYSGIRLTFTGEDQSRAMASCVISSSRVPFTINATGKATGLLIFLHGLGDDGNGWREGFNHIKQKHVQYVFPNAETMPVTLNMGMRMPSWFDIISLDMGQKEDEKGINKAAEEVRELMKREQEKAGVPTNKVVLGGFSMGGALALYTALTHPEPIGGLVLLSSWLPLREKFDPPQDGFSLTGQTCPIFQGHGDADPMVRTVFGSETHKIINDARKAMWKEDTKATFKTYRGMGHSSCDEEMDDVGQFLRKVLPPN